MDMHDSCGIFSTWGQQLQVQVIFSSAPLHKEFSDSKLLCSLLLVVIE